MEKGFVGIDLGTSAVKLLLMDESGHILKTVSKEYPISFPNPGWSEQNPYDWYDQTIAGLKELLEGLQESLGLNKVRKLSYLILEACNLVPKLLDQALLLS